MPKISRQRNVEVVKFTPSPQERISARRTVEQYLDVSVEIDKNVLSGFLRGYVSRSVENICSVTSS